MSQAATPELIEHVWSYSLFDALYGRRTRRFGRGFEIDEGPFRHRSAHPPMPLAEIEEALLVAAGIGFSGLALWDQARPMPYPAVEGRTFPSTCRGRRTALFFTNDAGVHVIDPAGDPPAAPTADPRAEILSRYRAQRRTLGQGRLAIPRRVPPLCGHNLWDANLPGASFFMPVCDVTAALISLIAQFVDPALGRFADGSGMTIVDDRHGMRPAGVEPWLRSGLLDPARVLPLSILERQACYFMFSEPAAICQNMFLATEALGVGGWMHCGFLSREILAALGFRMTAADGAPALANPIGLDAVFQAYCPPYFPSMDAAVDAALAHLARDRPAVTPGPTPHRLSDAEHRAGTVSVSPEGIACTKAVCRYILESYGRFPGTVDAMHLMWCFQAHHLDLDFYDRYYEPGSYGPRHADHIARWHPGAV